MSMTFDEACKVFDISPDASQEEIQKKYKKLAKKHHPDKGGDEAQFKRVNEANMRLKKGPDPEPEESDLGDWNTVFNHVFRNGMGGMGGMNFQQIHQVFIDPEMFIKGGNFDVQYQTVETRDNMNIMARKSVKVTVEPDTPVGARIAVPTGDARHMFVQLLPGRSARWTVSDNVHLTEIHKIDVFKAMMGCELEITSPRGKILHIKINPGTQSNTIHRLRGLGLKINNNMCGDLNLRIVVDIPPIGGKDFEEFMTELTKQAETSLK